MYKLIRELNYRWFCRNCNGVNYGPKKNGCIHCGHIQAAIKLILNCFRSE